MIILQIKCHQYWPSYGSATYDSFKVTLKSVETLAEYSIRVFTVEQVQFSLHEKYIHRCFYRLTMGTMYWKFTNFITLFGLTMGSLIVVPHCCHSTAEWRSSSSVAVRPWSSIAALEWAEPAPSSSLILKCRGSGTNQTSTFSTMSEGSATPGTTWCKHRLIQYNHIRM